MPATLACSFVNSLTIYSSHAPQGYSWKASFDEAGRQVHELQMGPFAKKMSATFKEIVLTLARQGHNIIIDDVAFGAKEIDLWRKTLKDYKVLWIGLTTPVEHLEEREKTRTGRIKGSARAQHRVVHTGVQYDLEFDTSKESLEDIVEAIQKRVRPTKTHENKAL